MSVPVKTETPSVTPESRLADELTISGIELIRASALLGTPADALLLDRVRLAIAQADAALVRYAGWSS